MGFLWVARDRPDWEVAVWIFVGSMEALHLIVMEQDFSMTQSQRPVPDRERLSRSGECPSDGRDAPQQDRWTAPLVGLSSLSRKAESHVDSA